MKYLSIILLLSSCSMRHDHYLHVKNTISVEALSSPVNHEASLKM